MASVDSRSDSESATEVEGSGVSLDVLELWVADLARTRDLLTTRFGFEPLDVEVEAAPESEGACLGCGGVAIVLWQGTRPDGPIARHVAAHGDTVGDLALVCRDPDAIAERAREHGLHVTHERGRTRVDVTGDGTIWHSLRATRLVHATASRPGVVPMRAIDHVTYCLPAGTAAAVARVYEDVFGLDPVDTGAIGQVGGSVAGMRSLVLRSTAGFTVVLTEPARAGGGGQTQRFVDAHSGPGVQHVAIAYDDICEAVERLRSRGVEFLPAPPGYYAAARERLSYLPLPWSAIEHLDVLVDADEDGLLFQLFTRPTVERGTFFFELIQRAGSSGFGANNVRALFAAVESAMHERLAPR